MRVALAGLSTVDAVQRVDELPEPGRKTQSRAAALAAGGPAANAAVTVAALGGEAVLFTVLGGHPLAELARSDLTAHGVAVVDLLPQRVEPPPLSAVTVRESDGERTVVSHNAAAVPDAELEPVVRALDFTTAVPGAEPGALLVDGHHPVLALAAARWARARNVPVVVDAGSWKPVFTEVFGLADVVACSAQFTVPDELGRRALDAVPTVVMTAGSEPVRWRRADEWGEVAVPRVAARDTVGAGDVWHGAFVSRLGELDVPVLIEYANVVASERVKHVGPRGWIGPLRARMGVR